MHSSFFAYLSRMRYIMRWGLMRNMFPENVQEHSHMVAVLAHALALIRRDVFGGSVNPERVAAIALYHDVGEIFTGDLPTPVKYQNQTMREAYRDLETAAVQRLLETLPEGLRDTYSPLLLSADPETHQLIKAADKLAAYIKCLEELKAGNAEFRRAGEQTRAALEASPLPETAYFMTHLLPAFSLGLDELSDFGG